MKKIAVLLAVALLAATIGPASAFGPVDRLQVKIEKVWPESVFITTQAGTVRVERETVWVWTRLSWRKTDPGYGVEVFREVSSQDAGKTGTPHTLWWDDSLVLIDLIGDW